MLKNQGLLHPLSEIHIFFAFIGGMPLAAFPILFPGRFFLPQRHCNLSRTLPQRQHFASDATSKPWKCLHDPRQVVTCHGDGGHIFDGFSCDSDTCITFRWVCNGHTDCEGKFLVH